MKPVTETAPPPVVAELLIVPIPVPKLPAPVLVSETPPPLVAILPKVVESMPEVLRVSVPPPVLTAPMLTVWVAPVNDKPTLPFVVVIAPVLNPIPLPMPPVLIVTPDPEAPAVMVPGNDMPVLAEMVTSPPPLIGKPVPVISPKFDAINMVLLPVVVMFPVRDTFASELVVPPI